MADKPNMMEITSFDKAKLKKTETREKNPLPTKEGECLKTNMIKLWVSVSLIKAAVLKIS
ncbi:thymosin beta-like [Astyanax mexicanus]|uniref:Uncharacterized protein n=2 Tax=Astyanax mexicanus TaxID=7994 RepID=A0A3B1J7R0_ASTMX|nr:thymosin beta-like [Astyanax mexicanus]